MNKIEKTRTARIIALHNEIGGALRTTLEKAIEIGGLLVEQKAELQHGEWSAWIAEHLPFAERTAREYMRFWERRDAIKTAQCADFTDARRLLSPPGDPQKGRLVEAARVKAQEAASEYLALLAEEGEAWETFARCREQAKRLLKNRPAQNDTDGATEWLSAILENNSRMTDALRMIAPELVEAVEAMSIDELNVLDEETELRPIGGEPF